MTDVSDSSGYHGYVDPGLKLNVSSCTQQDADAKDFMLHSKGSINSDQATIDINITQSQGSGQYVLDNMYGCGCGLKDARKVQLSQAAINFEGGKGWIGEKGCLVDTDTKLRQSKDRLTNKRYIHQLTERPYLTTKSLKTGHYDVGVESIIRPGIRTTDNRPCNSLSGVTIGNYFTPMIPKLREEVQNEKHIIPEDSMQSWIRGGLPTRQMARNEDYLRRCQQKTHTTSNQ
jgi:hypothetical protein